MTTVTWQTLAEVTANDNLLEKLHAERELEGRQPGEITVKDWATKYYDTSKRGMKTAYDELQSFVPRKMTKRQGKEGGHLCTFYKAIPAYPVQNNSMVVK